jgi:hypothetical protein
MWKVANMKHSSQLCSAQQPHCGTTSSVGLHSHTTTSADPFIYQGFYRPDLWSAKSCQRLLGQVKPISQLRLLSPAMHYRPSSDIATAQLITRCIVLLSLNWSLQPLHASHNAPHIHQCMQEPERQLFLQTTSSACLLTPHLHMATVVRATHAATACKAVL